MHLQETILCSTAAQGTTGTVTVHDLQSGTILASFKHTNAARHCTAVVESRDGQGGFILSAQPDKSILNVYHFQKVRTSDLFSFPSSFIFFALATGPTGDENCATGKAHVCSHRPTRPILRRRHCAGTNSFVGGESTPSKAPYPSDQN